MTFNPLANFSQGMQIGETMAAAPQRAEQNLLALQSQRQSVQQGQRTAEQENMQFDQSQAIQRAKIINYSAKALKQIDPSQWPIAVQKLAPRLQEFGIDVGQFDMNSLTPEALDNTIATTEGFIRDPSQLTASMREQQANIDLIKPFMKDGKFDRTKATPAAIVAAVNEGIIPRAVGSAAQTIASEGTSDLVGTSEGRVGELKKFGELTGKSRAEAIDSGFDRIQKINGNLVNIDRAIDAIDQGASTGTIESKWFPTFRQATKELNQIQKELGLDVVGSVTFGALSEGELGLALEVALPTNMEPTELRKFLIDKKQAQQKLRDYFERQIDFLDQGGTLAGFLRAEKRKTGRGDSQIGADAGQDTETRTVNQQRELAEGTIIRNSKTGQRFKVVNGQLQEVQ